MFKLKIREPVVTTAGSLVLFLGSIIFIGVFNYLNIFYKNNALIQNT